MSITPEKAARVADNIAKAAEAAERLARMGLTVESVVATHRDVRITVRPGRACAALKGQWSRMRVEAGKRLHHMVAVFHDCLVEWDTEYCPRPRPTRDDAPYWAHARTVELNPPLEA